ncbi:unnamed protein product [Rotaria sp. Silwood2]|nr:unnamed protein product [Rotaria sp. Silwood2]CAF3966791.1 unnamed protein product [Rotaria sp. Silwood2]
MSQHCTSTFRYHTVHPSLLPSPVSDRTVSSDCSKQTGDSYQQRCVINDQQHIYKTCHHHSSTDENPHRNNHNSNLIHFNQMSKLFNDITPRKRRKTIRYNLNEYYHRSNEKSSLLSIYINNILLILIRLMILFIIVLIICFTFYYAIIYIYSKPKKNEWEQIIDWLTQE